MLLQDPIFFSVSIVSHGHKRYVEQLLADIDRMGRRDIEVKLTLNLPELLDVDLSVLSFPCTVIGNLRPKGFAANHNTAFVTSKGEQFVILNPDISLPRDPFTRLRKFVEACPGSLASPLIVNANYQREDSARRFPTPLSLASRILARLRGRAVPKEIIASSDGVLMPDWIAGMFMSMPSAIYAELGGLSERFHLYCEDMDLCARARLKGYGIYVLEDITAIHNAQRDSHRRLKYLFWHLRSMAKFFFSTTYLRLMLARMRKSAQS